MYRTPSKTHITSLRNHSVRRSRTILDLEVGLEKWPSAPGSVCFLVFSSFPPSPPSPWRPGPTLLSARRHGQPRRRSDEPRRGAWGTRCRARFRALRAARVAHAENAEQPGCRRKGRGMRDASDGVDVFSNIFFLREKPPEMDMRMDERMATSLQALSGRKEMQGELKAEFRSRQDTSCSRQDHQRRPTLVCRPTPPRCSFLPDAAAGMSEERRLAQGMREEMVQADRRTCATWRQMLWAKEATNSAYTRSHMSGWCLVPSSEWTMGTPNLHG